MNFTELQTVVKRLIGNRSYITDTEIQSAINDAQTQLARFSYINSRRGRVELHFPELDALDTISLSDGVSDYTFPSDALSVNELHYLYDTSNNKYRELEILSWNNFLVMDTSRGKDPTHWTRRAKRVYVTPHPGSTQAGRVIRVSYYRAPATLTGSDTPELPSSYHRCIAYLAGLDILSDLNDTYAEKILQLLYSKLQQLQDPDTLTVGVGSVSRTIARSV